MQVWVRLFHVGWRALRHSGTADASFRSSLFFRVAPGDIDVNRHMNNGRYLTIMDLGRIDLLIRTGLWKQMRRNNWQGVVATQRIRYRHALDPWDRFRVDSRILCWNDDGIVFDHRMTRVRGPEEKMAAAATVRFVFTNRGRGKPRTADVLASAGILVESPPMPDEVQTWLQAEKKFASTRSLE